MGGGAAQACRDGISRGLSTGRTDPTSHAVTVLIELSLARIDGTSAYTPLDIRGKKDPVKPPHTPIMPGQRGILNGRSVSVGGGPTRRRLLLGLAGGLSGSFAGCFSALRDDSTSGIDVANNTAVGAPFTIRLSDELIGTVDRIEFTVDDSQDAVFRGSIEVPSTLSDRYLPVERLREDGESAFHTRTDASSATTITTGVGGEGEIRMVAHHLDSSAAFARFLPSDEPMPPDAADGSYEVMIDAIGESETVASRSTRRVLADPAVDEESVPAEDLVGRIAKPRGDGAAPGVAVLHGSGATDLYAWSRMLATHGYTVLTLKYFAEPSLPETLDDVPLEYFDRAVEWFTGRDDVLDNRMGFVGLSRGVEAALLTAAAFDGSATVVGYGGSGIVHPGLSEVYALDREEPPGQELGAAGWEAAWTRNGDPVASGDAIREAYGQIGALDLEALEPVGIDVESIDGPVLLVTGAEDALWRAPVFSEYAVRRRSAHDSQHPYAHFVYDGAGHLFFWPYRDYEGVLTADYLGGTPPANARAAADAWVRMLECLERGLQF